MRAIVFTALLLTSGAVAAFGQGRYMQLASQYAASHVYHEAVVLPGEAGADVWVAFRIPNDRLVFMKDRQPADGREFIASFEVTVDVRQGRELIDSRKARADHYAFNFDETRDRSRDYEGAVLFSLQPGEYTYVIRLNDLNARREGSADPRPLVVPEVLAPAVLPLFVVERSDKDPAGKRVQLSNLGGDAPYGRPFFLGIPVRLPPQVSPGDVRIEYVIRPDADEEDERPPRAGGRRLSGTIGGGELSGFSAARHVPEQGARILFADGGAETERYLAAVPVAGEVLPNGKYVAEVTLIAGEDRSTARLAFSTHWRDMPISLHDVDVAIANLSFIEERSVIRSLSRGTKAEREQAFLEYWRQRDPDPENEFNELMAEYYRRIDHAAFNFRTGTEPVPDGLRTDMAQVYIQHGEPDNVSRELPGRGSGVREIWTYSDGRTFVFEAASSLDRFRLVQS